MDKEAFLHKDDFPTTMILIIKIKRSYLYNGNSYTGNATSMYHGTSHIAENISFLMNKIVVTHAALDNGR